MFSRRCWRRWKDSRSQSAFCKEDFADARRLYGAGHFCCTWKGELAFVQAPPLGYNLPGSATYAGR